MKCRYIVCLLFLLFPAFCNQSANAQINLVKAESPNRSIFYTGTPFYSKFNDEELRRKLRQQKALKGFGIFNIVWGGLWFGAGTVFAIASSDNVKPGVAAALIGAGAGTMGLLRLKEK